MALKLITAGESHGPGLTTIVEGLPAGLELEQDAIDRDMARRQLGHGRGGRMKIEKDHANVTAGVRHGRTLGGPVALQVPNRDYANWEERMNPWPVEADVPEVHLPRPGHADLVGVLQMLGGNNQVRHQHARGSGRGADGLRLFQQIDDREVRGGHRPSGDDCEHGKQQQYVVFLAQQRAAGQIAVRQQRHRDGGGEDQAYKEQGVVVDDQQRRDCAWRHAGSRREQRSCNAKTEHRECEDEIVMTSGGDREHHGYRAGGERHQRHEGNERGAAHGRRSGSVAARCSASSAGCAASKTGWG